MVSHITNLLAIWYFGWLSIVCYEIEHPDLPVVDGLYVIENVKTDIDTDDRVFATMPPGFSIRQSGIPNSGLGVFAETTVPKNTRLGPFDGIIYNPTNSNHNWHYSWIINRKGEGVKHYIDSYDKSKASWLRYMNCARTVDEENLYIYFHNNVVYYVTHEDIRPGTELLIWYGDNYGYSLGLSRTTEDYQRRFNESEWKFIRHNTIKARVEQYSSSCFKFYETEPFMSPPGTQRSYSQMCMSATQYDVCKYAACTKNPCTGMFDCKRCKGYCFHHGRYIQLNTEFLKADNINTCVCDYHGNTQCTSEITDYKKMCTY